MINEDSGEEVECRYCDDGWNCEHLVAAFDMSFLSLDAGALGAQMDQLRLRVGEAAVRRLRADPTVLDRIRHPNLMELYGEVHSEIGDPLSEEEVDELLPYNVSSGHLFYLGNEILSGLEGVEEPSGSVYEGDTPGYSSAMKIYWSTEPQQILARLEEELVRYVAEGT